MEHRDTEAWYQERHRLTEVLMAAKPGEEQAKAFRDLQEWNALDSTVQAAERVSAKFQELDSALQEWDTSAAEASKAFQGLQEETKGLVDLEIVIPSGHQTDPTPLPRGTSLEWTDYLDQVADEHDRNCSPEQEDDIDQALRDLPPEPWYKRLWSWLRGTK